MSESKNSNVQAGSVPVVGFSIGDVNGIGPEILLRLLEDSRILRLCTPVIYGNHRILNRYRKLLGLEEVQTVPCKSAGQALPRKINMLNCWDEDYEIRPGESDSRAGELALLALEKAGEDLKEDHIQALVTLPVNKSAMPEARFPYPGQTEFFARLAGRNDALMMMVSDTMRIALATVHQPFQKVAGMLTRQLIQDRLQQVESVLKDQFDLDRPRIAVLGLNPHAGENGKLGQEEEAVIGPVIRDWRGKGKHVYGPFPADGFFASGDYRRYDAVLAMYHDQGLVPFKVIAGYEGVNFTAGLPFLRVSPDHGTAYDKAGKGVSDCSSARAALFLALDLLRLKADKVRPALGSPRS